MKLNPLTALDSYKLGHMAQYPKGTDLVYANFTPRTLTHLNKNLPKPVDHIVWFGLQGVLKEMRDMWDEGFFNRDCEECIEAFARRIYPFVGPSGFDFDKIRELHKIGYLPLKFKALPEGSLVPVGVPCLTVRNTKPEAYWLVNYIESYLSAELWKMSTSATIARVYREMLDEYAEKTGSSKEFVDWQGHDFSYRGMSGTIDAAKSGAGHLLSFTGSDSVPAVDYIEKYYFGKESGLIAGSVPASEHSVVCMGGEEDEINTFKRLMTEVYPAGIVSLVSDTYDFFKVITEYFKELKPIIMNRQPDCFGNCKIVARPDSGTPELIICGNPEAPEGSPEHKGAVECLWEIFGGTITEKGYKLLDSHVGLIYGDSITPMRCKAILEGLEKKGFASGNVVLGIGSFTYQYNTRDTLGFAMKTTYGGINGVGRDIFKNPKTDSGFKKSAKGLLVVQKNTNGEFVLLDQQSPQNEGTGYLKPVFIDGNFFVNDTFAEIRNRLAGK